MYDVYITYDDEQDRELLEMVNTKTPAYLHFYDMKTTEGKKGGWKVKSKYSAKLDPFVLIQKDREETVFYSDGGKNAVRQLIKWLNG